MASALLRCNAPFLSSNHTPRLKSHGFQIPKSLLIRSQRSSIIACKLKNEEKLSAEATSKMLLEYAKRNRDSEVALGVIKEFTTQGGHETLPNVYEYMILRLGREREFEQMREAVAIMPQPTELAFILMITTYGFAHMVSDAISVLSLMEQMGVPPTTRIYNLIFHFLLEEDRVPMVEELFEKTRAAGVKPDITTFNSVIDARCRYVKADSAMALFEEMEQYGVRANKTTYELLMDGFYQEGRLKDGWEVYRKMCSAKPPVSD